MQTKSNRELVIKLSTSTIRTNAEYQNSRYKWYHLENYIFGSIFSHNKQKQNKIRITMRVRLWVNKKCSFDFSKPPLSERFYSGARFKHFDQTSTCWIVPAFERGILLTVPGRFWNTNTTGTNFTIGQEKKKCQKKERKKKWTEASDSGHWTPIGLCVLGLLIVAVAWPSEIKVKCDILQDFIWALPPRLIWWFDIRSYWTLVTK